MSLQADIKKGMFAAMKAKNAIEKEILRVALGEIQTAASRADDRDLSDAAVQAILKKLIKSNREALAATAEEETKETLSQEIDVLQRYLPQVLSVAEIGELLAAAAEAIKGAAAEGPAMGIAMKTLKQAGAEVNAPDVKKAVEKLRA